MTPIRTACFVLSLMGAAVGTYLTAAHFTSTSILACPSSGIINCARVTTSPQSYFLNIPVAVWGLIFFLYLSVINSPWGFKQENLKVPRLGSMFLGVAFVLWLLSAELLIINSICLWCSVVHVITISIFALVVYDYFASPAMHVGG
ncbi:MAG: vitamin K epoxide reductase family protein [Acidimicrobiaceae bacterium]|nr:vitamin K epoxide reductase family protein [Acidimicrobiaceae bacterium]